MIIAEQIKSLTELLPTITKVESGVIDKPRDLEYLVNTAFLARKCAEILKMMEKSLNTMGEKAEEQSCLVLANLEEPKYSTEYCTASPNPSFYVKHPASPKDPGFAEFVRLLPVEALRTHFPTVGELVVKSFQEGKGIPFGLTDIKGCTLKLRITTKKEL